MSELRCGTCGELEYPKWISVKDRLPKKYERVLIFIDGKISVGEYYGKEDGGWASYEPTISDNVTHWTYLPEPPDHMEFI